MRADRLLSILMLLQSKGRQTAAELAAVLEVSERTIYRDVTALGISGVPVYTEPGPGGGISLIESYRSDLTGLTTDEVQALFMFSIPSPLMDLGYDQKLKGALRKLSAALPATLRGDEQRVRQRIHIDNDPWEESTEVLPHLLMVQQAVWDDRVLDIAYQSYLGSRVGPLAATIEPLGLVAKAGVWYVVGNREDHIMVLEVERLLQVGMRGQRFERQSDFDLVTFWQGWCAENQDGRSLFRVTVRIVPELLPEMQGLLGDVAGTQSGMMEEAGPDGRIRMSLWFTSFEEARGRLLGYGRALEVVEPLALRLSVADYARQIVDVYAGG
ncbi:MAG: WYL domain-containing protein [Chloroflexi bacterium]|jgi:predicted DNA-binding transcriptional regulator YafY|nr:WYL domain-containing protein [Chloroflexota bacterium]